MNTLDTPGFTAEASLPGTSGHYHKLHSTDQAANGMVLPQFSWCYPSIYPGVNRCCYCNPWGENCTCRYVGWKSPFPNQNGD
jgi:hypothetical protein